jgi:hypothetical protein
MAEADRKARFESCAGAQQVLMTAGRLCLSLVGEARMAGISVSFQFGRGGRAASVCRDAAIAKAAVCARAASIGARLRD